MSTPRRTNQQSKGDGTAPPNCCDDAQSRSGRESGRLPGPAVPRNEEEGVTLPQFPLAPQTGASTRDQFLKDFAAKRAADGMQARPTKPLPDKDVAALSAPGKLKPRVEHTDQPELFAKTAAPQPDDVGPGLFDTAEERQAREDAQSHDDKLLGDQLTAQFKSGLPMRPAKIKPKKAGNLFEEEGPE